MKRKSLYWMFVVCVLCFLLTGALQSFCHISWMYFVCCAFFIGLYVVSLIIWAGCFKEMCEYFGRIIADFIFKKWKK